MGLTLMTACAQDPTAPGDHRPPLITDLPRALTVDELHIIGASNSFAFRLLNELSTEAVGENLFFSPLSASMALGMVMNGAAGTIWEEMRTTLGFAGLDEGQINDAYLSLIDLLLTLDATVTVDIGNSVWAATGAPPHNDFRARVEEHFNATVESVDFSAPETVDRINQWASDATRGKISKMYDSLPANTVVALLNALYFKGDWRDQFDPADTRPAPFQPSVGGPVQVPMMWREVTAPFYQDAEVAIVDLPYGGAAFSFTAVLPAQGTSVDELVSGLDEQTWTEWTRRLANAESRLGVGLPKFEMNWEKQLNDVLVALGMPTAFGPAADFTRMLPGGFVIDDVKQKAVIEVNEEGTVAAAVTGVVGVTSAPPQVTFDRPFFFAIRERLSGTILFAGVLHDPAAS